jgi:hypothetical protein
VPGAAVSGAAVAADVAAVAGVDVGVVVPTFLFQGSVDVEDAVKEADSVDSDLAASTICSPAPFGSFLSGFGALDNLGASGSVGGGGGGQHIEVDLFEGVCLCDFLKLAGGRGAGRKGHEAVSRAGDFCYR